MSKIPSQLRTSIGALLVLTGCDAHDKAEEGG